MKTTASKFCFTRRIISIFVAAILTVVTYSILFLLMIKVFFKTHT